MAHGLVKVVFIVQLDGRMLRFLLQMKLHYHWHYLAPILVESQLLWQVDTDQSRSVYLVRLISIWYCNWFMLFMTLDMPDEGTR